MTIKIKGVNLENWLVLENGIVEWEGPVPRAGRCSLGVVSRCEKMWDRLSYYSSMPVPVLCCEDQQSSFTISLMISSLVSLMPSFPSRPIPRMVDSTSFMTIPSPPLNS